MSFAFKNYSEIYKFADGGISEIFYAIERSNNRNVVIKKITLDSAHRSSSLKLIENEIRCSSSLTHNNIISIIDHGIKGDNFYIVMEYIEGCDLNTLISDASFNRKIGLIIVLKMLQALRFAHKNGVVHCNIKPANLLISKTGKVVLSDFGLTLSKAHAKKSQNGCGDFTTHLFMPPEQPNLVTMQGGLESDIWADVPAVNNTEISAKQARALYEKGMKWDIWSAGVLLYRVCSGYYPFYNDDFTNLFISIKYLDPTKIQQLVTGLPHPIVEVIEHCLKKKPYDRPHSLDPVIKTLQQYISSLGITHIDETIAAYVRKKMGIFGNPGETDALFSDIVATDLPLTMPSKFESNYNEHKTIQQVPPQQSPMQHAYGFLHTQFRKCTSLFSKAKKNSLNRDRSLTSFSPSSRSRIALPLVALTFLVFMMLLGAFIINGYKVKFYDITNFTPSSIVNMHGSLSKPEVQSVYSAIKRVEDFTDTATKSIVSGLPASRTKIDLSSSQVSSAEPPQTEKPVLSATQVLAIKNIAMVKPENVSGVLKIMANPPEAQVFIDGTLITQDELSSGKRVAPGSHKIIAQATGHVTYDQSIRIESNKTKMLAIELKSDVKGNGQLHIYSYPWANLYIDDALIGTTPTPSPISLVEGNHKVVLMRDGYQPYNELVAIRNSEVTRLQVQLKKTGEE
jgi:serine/threonine protein kinase